jgi:undecaprenyl-diphosphatase
MDFNLEKLADEREQGVTKNFPFLVIAISISGWMGCAIALGVLNYFLTGVLQQSLHPAEVATLERIHHHATPQLDRLMLAITQLGNPTVIVPVGLITLTILLIQQARWEAWIFAIAGLGTILLNEGLKLQFAKLRPALWPQLIHETSFSFPSGHALGTTVLYGLTAYLLASRWPQYRFWIYGATLGLVTAIGFSRLYLGVHWPTDVLAGWLVGLLWLTTCIILVRLPRQMQAESPTRSS